MTAILSKETNPVIRDSKVISNLKAAHAVVVIQVARDSKVVQIEEASKVSKAATCRIEVDNKIRMREFLRTVILHPRTKTQTRKTQKEVDHLPVEE
jgi:hypothetical protein